MPLPTEKEMDDAIRRLAMTADGRLLYRRLQMVLMSLPQSPKGGALRENVGRRTFARELKLLMDEEMAKVVTTRDRADTHDPDAPAVAARAEPISVARAGTGRRVADYSDSGTP